MDRRKEGCRRAPGAAFSAGASAPFSALPSRTAKSSPRPLGVARCQTRASPKGVNAVWRRKAGSCPCHPPLERDWGRRLSVTTARSGGAACGCCSSCSLGRVGVAQGAGSDHLARACGAGVTSSRPSPRTPPRAWKPPLRPFPQTPLGASSMETAAPVPSGPAAAGPFPPLFPPGLHGIYGECRRLYPEQPNPLQVTAILKYWLGGPDPLDYVSMYRNLGNPTQNVPEHWHYVSFGLSDLYGDNRVHEFTGPDGPSGFGFELTFRLKRETGESAPPTWPAELMQGLARYVFQSENTFCSGDHVSWHSPLDNSESRIQHMLLTEDPQMQPVQTPFGVVTFLQIVGVCTEELHAAQQWNGQGILELLRTVPVAGGPWLITDMRRGETIFEIDPHLQDRVDKGIETDGSNLSGVSAKCAWDDLSRPPEDDEDSRSICIGTHPRRLSGKDTEQIRETLRRGLEINSKPILPPINTQRQNGLNNDRAPSRKDSLESDSSAAIIPHELIRTRQLESVHLKFNQESGALIPLCLRGRLLHGRHFTYKSITGDTAITFVSTGVEGAFATEEHPYAAHGPWLQILLTEEFVERMLEDLDDLNSPEEFKLPKEYSWPEKKLKVSILPDTVFDNPLH